MGSLIHLSLKRTKVIILFPLSGGFPVLCGCKDERSLWCGRVAHHAIPGCGPNRPQPGMQTEKKKQTGKKELQALGKGRGADFYSIFFGKNKRFSSDVCH